MRLLPPLTFLGTAVLAGTYAFPHAYNSNLKFLDSPVVSLDYGTFVGKINATTGITYYLGVQYADPPLGDLRWRAAVSPPSKQLGVVNATQYRDGCITTSATQLDVTAGTSEDCLYGNIFVPPSTTPQPKLPVLVWFHGGGFQGGNSHDAQPELLFESSGADRPFILVSIEYRLGQFGFLAGAAVKNDGQLNAGLNDQRTALKWVQRYIGEFGGDPDRVTIWGLSAGAGSTMFHLIANNGDSEGLFQAAMGDSPSLSYMPAWNDAYLERLYEQVAEFAGCNTSEDTLSCLRGVNASTLALAGAKTLQARGSTLYAFAPCMDGELITMRPVEAFGSGKFARVNVLFGSNTNEGANWSNSLPSAAANTSMPNATETTVYNFIRGQYAPFTNISFAQGLELYPNATYNASMSMQGQQMYGEARYICSASLIGSGVASVGDRAWVYRYNNPNMGSNHGSEIQAMWGTPSAKATAQDKELFSRMREYWTSFVTGGEPVSSAVAWEEFGEGRRLLLDPSGIQMEDIPSEQAERCAFWHGISEELNT